MHNMEDIRALHRAWIQAELQDPLGVLHFCTEGIRFYPAKDTVIQGKEAITAWLREAYAGSRLIDIEILDLQITVLEPLASLQAEFRTTIDAAGGDVQVFYGTHFWMLNFTGGGWKVDSMTWKVEPKGDDPDS